MDTENAIYIPGQSISSIESCAGQVRWSKGVLEQLWHVQHVGTLGLIERAENVWRPVPEASDGDQ